MLGPLPLKAAGEHRAAAVHRAQQQDEGVEVRGLEVEGGELQVEVREPNGQRHAQVDEEARHGALDGPAGLFPGRLGLVRRAAVKALPLEAAGVGTGKWHIVLLSIRCDGYVGTGPVETRSFHFTPIPSQ